jgi:hypothetical protein
VSSRGGIMSTRGGSVSNRGCSVSSRSGIDPYLYAATRGFSPACMGGSVFEVAESSPK